jgi:hypothetical protein
MENKERNNQPIGTKNSNIDTMNKYLLQYGILILQCPELFAIYVHDRTDKFECFQY